MSGDHKSKLYHHDGGARAVHVVEDGDGVTGHGVVFSDLRAILFQEDGYWIAQGLEVDYLAYAPELEDAKRSFENGLACTIEENLRRFNTIEKMLRPAPVEAWKRFLEAQAKHTREEDCDHPFRYSQEIVRIIEHDTLQRLGFQRISYIEPGEQQAEAAD